MEAVVNSALEEICAVGAKGLTLPDLWPKLQSSFISNGLPPCGNVKKAVWANLLNIPGLHFESRGGVCYNSHDSVIQSVEDSEKLNLKIVAAEHLRNCFVGLYDIKASNTGISVQGRRALERIAIARTNGITQSELGKEFGLPGNKIFYVLRKLECQGLIVRQSTILRKTEVSSDRGQKNSTIVSTNMIHLYRFAKHLGCQQRLEVIKEDKLAVNEDEDAPYASGMVEESVIEDVQVKDFLPELKHICDKLEEADNNVLIVSDLKKDLGYCGTSGHRRWRNILHRLKDARVVEEFTARVNTKEVSCLKLLKKFSPRHFEPKSVKSGADDLDVEEPVILGKRGQINDLLVELPIEHQVYDMIDAEGSKGLTKTELCKRLGLNNKRYNTRLQNLFSRFGMHLQAESHNRGVAYRVWSHGNFNREASSTFMDKPDIVLDDNGTSVPNSGERFGECSTEYLPLEDDLADKGDTIITEEIENGSTELEIYKGLPAVGDLDMLLGPGSPENLSPAPSRIPPVAELQIVNKTPISEENIESPNSSTPHKQRSHAKYLCLTMNNRQREHRILELLQEKRFMIKAELHRQLESLDKDKQTTMDRKTLERSLNKLQQEGLCKLIHVGVPAVTNCGRSRTMDMVLHPSLDNISPELLSQIYERVRSFEMQIRNHQSSAKLKKGKEAPILDGVQRILTNVREDQSEKIEAMRDNGYVPAKMVRTKLLHIFLWHYLTKLPGWNDALSSGMHGYDQNNPHSTCKMIELDAAIKAMPLELFLQIVGSTIKFEDMTQKCRTGMCLSDLSVQEYKQLIGTLATVRLSNLVQILRGLKLIRMVRNENVGDAAAVLDTTMAYSLELKPYIEEPVSLAPSSSAFISFDIRPQYRHDFVLSSRKAVDEYWNTLEYCYAAVDRKAALHAFPGSAVHEVYLTRSWASARVMTADQRTELNKCIMKNGPDKKLSLGACEKIAKDLSLSLEQVLRVYYDNRQRRNTRVKQVLNKEEIQPLNRIHALTSRKRKRFSKKRPSEHAKADSVDSVLPIMSSDTGDKFIDGHNDLGTSAVEQENNMSNDQVDENMKSTEEFTVQEKDEDDNSFISEHALSRLKPTQRRKFSWTENADRQLVIEYARERAALGANFHRIDWNALTNLPASPAVCKRRMALLNSSIQFRKAVLKLCNILTERYAKHLNKLQNKSIVDGECRVMVRDNASAGYNCGKDSDGLQQSQEMNPEDQWDNFHNKDVKVAFDEALRHKRTAKLDVHRELHSVSDEFSHLREDGEQNNDPKLLSSAISNKRKRKRGMRNNVSGRLQKKYIKFLNGGNNVNRRAFKSLAVSNAVELFKLVFLNASTAPEVPTLLAETLRRYSEHDLLTAFNYLRDAKIMELPTGDKELSLTEGSTFSVRLAIFNVGGSGASPFVLSQKFIHGISSSPYPTNTGKIAAEFRRWLHGKEKNLMEEGIDIPATIQCGDVIYLSALLSSREILISPCLPDKGVGEAEDLRTPKRTHDNVDCVDKAKKPKPATIGEGEICSRREKGFPGIGLSLTRATISRVDIIELFKERDIHSDEFLCGRNEQKASYLVGNTKTDHMKEILDLGTAVPLKISADDTPWEAMTCYADNLKYVACNQVESPFSPQIFKTVYSTIQKAGDQGLSMEKISKVTNIQGDKMAEIIVEVLEAFGRALKVNAYDSVHVVDSLYRSKYCLTSLGDPSRYYKEDPSTYSSLISDKQDSILHQDNHEKDLENVPSTSINDNDVHRVTILNLPKDIQSSSEVQKDTESESCQQHNIFPERHQVNDIFKFYNGSSYLCRPILSWMNGDGTINEVVYKGLIRRVLGILMQNPGMLEVDIIRRMHILNPQSCRKLLELMILDNSIIVRKMHQATSCGPPAILGGLIRSSFKKPKFISREHFFANPMSAATML